MPSTLRVSTKHCLVVVRGSDFGFTRFSRRSIVVAQTDTSPSCTCIGDYYYSRVVLFRSQYFYRRFDDFAERNVFPSDPGTVILIITRAGCRFDSILRYSRLSIIGQFFRMYIIVIRFNTRPQSGEVAHANGCLREILNAHG